MDQIIENAIFCLGLFIGMLIMLKIGQRIGARQMANDPKGARVGTGAIEAAVFGLLGLLIAFSFSGAVSRFDARRQMIVQETNAIGTAYLRLDLLPANAQPELRENFRHYLDSRLEVYRKLPDVQAATAALANSMKLQQQIWKQAVAAFQAEEASSAARMLLISALNEMIDIDTTRKLAFKVHPPLIIFGMLFLVALASALMAGYGMAGSKSRKWLHVICFALIIAFTVFVILDIEYPRLGLIRVNAFDQALVELRETMN